MGLLDDAIREHLDLKRRRGGDPTEIARMEQEALGPVRRERAAADDAPAEDPAVAEGAAGEHEMPPPSAPDERPQPADAGLPPEADVHPLPSSERHEGAHGDPLSPAREQRPAHEDTVDQPTTEYRVEDHHDDAPQDAPADRPDVPPSQHAEPEHAPAEPALDDDEHADPAAAADRSPEDVLEETPDFLQETPEHDRLWFEQRPPRDFDFDD